MMITKIKNYLVYILLFGITIGYAQNEQTTPKVTAPNALDSKGLRHGLWYGFFDDSKLLRYEGKFNHGKEIGMFTYYANSDKRIVMATRNFDGKNNAYTIFYDENKNKVSEGNMVNKLREGVWKYYHKNSKVIMTIENYKKDKLEGPRKVFYINNILGEEVAYKNNLKEGLSKKYSKEGKLVEESMFVNDLLQGPYTVYDEKGNIVIKGQFKSDKKNGIWKYYNEGKFVRQMNADTINGHKKPILREKK